MNYQEIYIYIFFLSGVRLTYNWCQMFLNQILVGVKGRDCFHFVHPSEYFDNALPDCPNRSSEHLFCHLLLLQLYK